MASSSKGTSSPDLLHPGVQAYLADPLLIAGVKAADVNAAHGSEAHSSDSSLV